MKLVVLLICALVFTVSAKIDYDENFLKLTPRLGEPRIKEIVKGIVDRSCHGVPSLGIPKLEPFQQLQPVDVKLNHSMAEVNGQVSNILVAGLSGFELVNVKLSATMLFSFEIKITKVKASGKFKLKGSLGGLFPIDGDGSFDFKVTDIKLIGSGRFATIDNGLQVAGLIAQPSITKLESKIVNLVPNEEVNDFINQMLEEIGPELLEKVWLDIGDDILKQIEQLSKSLIAGIELKDIIKILLGNTPVFHPDDPHPDCTPVVIP